MSVVRSASGDGISLSLSSPASTNASIGVWIQLASRTLGTAEMVIGHGRVAPSTRFDCSCPDSSLRLG